MILNYIYDSINDKNILSIDNLIDIFPDIIINIYDISYTKEKKKSKVILNKYAAKELPFFEITDDNKNVLYFSYAENRKNKLTLNFIIEVLNKLYES